MIFFSHRPLLLLKSNVVSFLSETPPRNTIHHERFIDVFEIPLLYVPCKRELLPPIGLDSKWKAMGGECPPTRQVRVYDFPHFSPACTNKDKRSLWAEKLFPTRVYVQMYFSMCFSVIETQQQSPPPLLFTTISLNRCALFISPSENSEAKPGKKCFCERIFFLVIINGIKFYEGNDFLFIDMRSFWQRSNGIICGVL